MNGKFNLHWDGMLTVENIQEVVSLLSQLLDGKRYTFVTANEIFQFKPEVRTGQSFNPKGSTSGKAINVCFDETNKDSPKHAGFNVGDTYGVWGCSTSLTEDKYDSEYNNPYFHFEYNKVTITHRAPAGHLLYWVAAIEQD